MKNFILYSGLLAIMAAGGCKKYLDINTDPNLVTEPPINGLLASTTSQTGINVQRMGNLTSYYVQYLSSPNAGSDRDTYKEEDLSLTWAAHYDVMTDIKEMMTLATGKGATQHVGVGKILMAINLNMLINMFGDVPYSEAFQGQQLLTPKYDDQQALHDTTIRLLDEAITALNQGGSTLELDASSDMIHGGSVNNWKKTAYLLRARFMNQLSKRADLYQPELILQDLDSSYASNDDDAALTVFQELSPWNAVAFDNTQLILDGWLSEQFVDALNGTTFGFSDPRLPLITDTTQFGDFRGTPNGRGRVGSGTDNEESVLTLTGFYSRTNAPLWLATYAEAKFIEAEAAFRLNNKMRAYEAYREGIRAHMSRLGVSEGDINAYLGRAAVSVGADDLTLSLIFKEKWIAMFLHPESWVDARRIDYMYEDFALPENTTLGTYIRRVAYPVVETSRNGKNVSPVAGLDEKLWWDE